MIVQFVGILGVVFISFIAVISVLAVLIYILNRSSAEHDNKWSKIGWVASFGFAIICAALVVIAIQRNEAQDKVKILAEQIEQMQTQVQGVTTEYDYIVNAYSRSIYTNSEGKQFAIFENYGNFYEFPYHGEIEAWENYILLMNDNNTPDIYIDDYIVNMYKAYEYYEIPTYDDGYGNDFNDYYVEQVRVKS